ncbi:MAG: transglutaminase domain-containing protein, partial [Lachnospiraceae bacterium]|nr:transglutaminase domain-containing protein [Lachnospiraceae bacterium]
VFLTLGSALAVKPAFVFAGENSIQQVMSQSKKKEPVFPKSVKKSYVGLAKATDGKWYYVRKRKVVWDYNNLVYFKNQWVYVHNGMIDKKYDTLSQVNGKGAWYCVTNGVLNWNYTGLFLYKGTRFYVRKGVVEWSFNNLVKSNGVWFYVKNGMVDKTYSNLVYYNNQWFYVHNGQIDWKYNTLSQVNGKGAWYCVTNGVLNWNYTGLFLYNKNWFYVRNGVVDWSFNGLVNFNGGWFYVKNGMIDWTYSNLVFYNNQWFYVHNGKIDWSLNTLAQVNGKGSWYCVSKGVIDWNFTGLRKYNGAWYYISKGVLDWTYTGLCLYNNVWYYVRNGVRDNSFTGLVPFNENYYYVKNGVLDWTYNGKAKIQGFSRDFTVVNGVVSGGIVPPSEEVSKTARNILNQIGWDIYSAYKYCLVPWTTYTVGGEIGTAYYADYGFRARTGNCYVMAAMFTALARELGYEAYQMSGYVADVSIHSWVEIRNKADGKFYVCDPDLESERGVPDFCFNYGTPGTWRYTSYYKMHN